MPEVPPMLMTTCFTPPVPAGLLPAMEMFSVPLVSLFNTAVALAPADGAVVPLPVMVSTPAVTAVMLIFRAADEPSIAETRTDCEESMS